MSYYETSCSSNDRHVRRTFGLVPVESIEISGSQMVLVMKLSTFAWNVYDGRRKLEVCGAAPCL